MRSLPEWIGKTDDSRPPPRVRLRLFEAFNRCCQCGCGRPIAESERWELDHTKALVDGGENRESNLRPLLVAHHRRKTKDDVALKAYNYRRRLARAGIKRRKRIIPGSRNSKWKVTFGRGTVLR